MKSQTVTIEMKATEPEHSPVLLVIMFFTITVSNNNLAVEFRAIHDVILWSVRVQIIENCPQFV